MMMTMQCTNLTRFSSSGFAGCHSDAAATATAAIQPTLYVILNYLFRIMLEFFVLAFGVDVVDLSPIDAIYSSTLLICIIGFSTVCMIMLYQFIIWIKSYGLLLIFPTEIFM